MKKIWKLEDLRASEKVFPTGDPSVEKQVHEAQVLQWDTRRALALASVHQSEAPISFLRSVIQRGNLDQAKELVEKLKSSEEMADAGFKSLIEFEQARIAFFESDWTSVISHVGHALEWGATPVNQLALFQLRANAFFELGDFTRCARDIEEVEQLGQLFPHAVSLFYAMTLRIRLIARLQSSEQAQKELDFFLNRSIQSGRSDLDLLLTYLRVKIDIQRLSLGRYENEALACFLISDAIGDKLYCGLAKLDYYSAVAASTEALRSQMKNARNEFRRIERLLGEIGGLFEASTSASTILKSLGSSPLKSSENESLLIEGSFSRTHLFIPGVRIFANLKTGKLIQFPEKGSRIFHALEALLVPELTKKKFFSEIWGKQAYAPRLHDTLISSLLHRIKKDCALSVQVSEGEIGLSGGERIFKL